MKKLLIGFLMLGSISAKADVLKAFGESEQRVVPFGLKSSAIRDAKRKLREDCLRRHPENVCETMKFELDRIKVITHRDCGGTIFGPDGRCTYVQAEVWGRI